VSGIALGPDSMLVTATYSGKVTVWDAVTGEEEAVEELGEQAVVVAVSPDGRYVVTGGSGQVIRIWDAELDPVGELSGHDNWVRELQFRRSDGALVSVGYDGRAFLWKDLPDTGGQNTGGIALTERSSPMESLAISPDGTTIAVGNAEGQVVLWDLGGREARRTDRPTGGGHTGSVTGVAYDRTGRWLITADAAGTLRLWDTQAGLESWGLLGQVGRVEAVTTAGRTGLVSVGDGGPARWTLDTEEWGRRACAAAGRNLSDEEAERYGFERAPVTCPGLPDG
jgi:WD40 repeat protein